MKRVSVGRGVLASVLAIVAMFVIQIVLGYPANLLLSINQDLGIVAYTLAYNGLAFFTVWALIRWFLASELADFGLSKVKIKAPYLLLGVILPVLIVFVISVLVPGQWEGAGTGQTLRSVIVELLIFTGLFGSIIEEVVLRGLVYHLMRQRLPIFWSALFSGILFAVLHAANPGFTLSELLIFIAMATIIGMYFAYLTELTGTVWAAAWGHLVWNVLNAVTNVSKQFDDYSFFNYIVKTEIPFVTGERGGPLFTIVGSVVLVMMTIWIAYTLRRPSRDF